MNHCPKNTITYIVLLALLVVPNTIQSEVVTGIRKVNSQKSNTVYPESDEKCRNYQDALEEISAYQWGEVGAYKDSDKEDEDFESLRDIQLDYHELLLKKQFLQDVANLKKKVDGIVEDIPFREDKATPDKKESRSDAKKDSDERKSNDSDSDNRSTQEKIDQLSADKKKELSKKLKTVYSPRNIKTLEKYVQLRTKIQELYDEDDVNNKMSDSLLKELEGDIEGDGDKEKAKKSIHQAVRLLNHYVHTLGCNKHGTFVQSKEKIDKLNPDSDGVEGAARKPACAEIHYLLVHWYKDNFPVVSRLRSDDIYSQLNTSLRLIVDTLPSFVPKDPDNPGTYMDDFDWPSQEVLNRNGTYEWDQDLMNKISAASQLDDKKELGDILIELGANPKSLNRLNSEQSKKDLARIDEIVKEMSAVGKEWDNFENVPYDSNKKMEALAAHLDKAKELDALILRESEKENSPFAEKVANRIYKSDGSKPDENDDTGNVGQFYDHLNEVVDVVNQSVPSVEKEETEVDVADDKEDKTPEIKQILPINIQKQQLTAAEKKIRIQNIVSGDIYKSDISNRLKDILDKATTWEEMQEEGIPIRKISNDEGISKAEEDIENLLLEIFKEDVDKYDLKDIVKGAVTVDTKTGQLILKDEKLSDLLAIDADHNSFNDKLKDLNKKIAHREEQIKALEKGANAPYDKMKRFIYATYSSDNCHNAKLGLDAKNVLCRPQGVEDVQQFVSQSQVVVFSKGAEESGEIAKPEFVKVCGLENGMSKEKLQDQLVEENKSALVKACLIAYDEFGLSPKQAPPKKKEIAQPDEPGPQPEKRREGGSDGEKRGYVERRPPPKRGGYRSDVRYVGYDNDFSGDRSRYLDQRRAHLAARRRGTLPLAIVSGLSGWVQGIANQTPNLYKTKLDINEIRNQQYLRQQHPWLFQPYQQAGPAQAGLVGSFQFSGGIYGSTSQQILNPAFQNGGPGVSSPFYPVNNFSTGTNLATTPQIGTSVPKTVPPFGGSGRFGFGGVSSVFKSRPNYVAVY